MKPLVILALAASAAGAAAQQPARSDVAGWRDDLHLLARELPQRHVRPFTKLTRVAWDSAVRRLDARLPTLSRNQYLVEMFRLVALLGDAHSNVQPDPAPCLRFYPIELYHFDDGLYVRRAAPAVADLAGARVARLGRVSVDSALAATGTIVSHENEWWVRAWGPLWLTVPEIVDGLGRPYVVRAASSTMSDARRTEAAYPVPSVREARGPSLPARCHYSSTAKRTSQARRLSPRPGDQGRPSSGCGRLSVQAPPFRSVLPTRRGDSQATATCPVGAPIRGSVVSSWGRVRTNLSVGPLRQLRTGA